MKIKSIVTFAGTTEVIQFRLKRVRFDMSYSQVLNRVVLCVLHDYNHYYTHYKFI